MKSRFLIIVFLSIASSCVVAQQTPAKKNKCGCSFTSINQLGFLAGENGESYQLQTVNGLSYRTWMVGAGVGIDGYINRSIPLFLHLRKEFNLKTSVLFLYNDIGLTYPWLNDDQKMFRGESDYDPGIYYDGGLGYKVPLRKNNALVFSGGFSLKEFVENRTSPICPFSGPCFDQGDKYKYSLRRLSFKVGIQL